LLGVEIVDATGVPEPASRRRDPLLRRALMTMSGLARFERRWPALAGVNLPGAADRPPTEDVDAVSGALMYLPRAAFERVGGFDEGYFLHAEDLDLCRRVRDAGLRVACVNTIRVEHGKGGSSRHRPLFVSWHKHRGMWRWFTTYDPAARNPLLRGLAWIGLWLHFAARAPFDAWHQTRATRQR
jgi:GT2 family glycosyltransferase